MTSLCKVMILSAMTLSTSAVCAQGSPPQDARQATFINRSNDVNNSEIVIFQKNVVVSDIDDGAEALDCPASPDDVCLADATAHVTD
jgi:hypothetical protein